MIIDLHIHTIGSEDSLIAAEDLIEQALRIGLDGICVTEHNLFQASEIVEEFAFGTPLKVFRAVEIDTDLGHLLVYGLDQKQWQEVENKPKIHTQQLIDYVRDCGGVCVPAHPFRFQSSSIGEKLETLIGIFAIDGYNGKSDIEENRLAWEYAKRFNLKLIGGSDAHIIGDIGKCVTEFPKYIETMSELVEQLKSGQFQAKYLL
ncbi:MAG: PHP domain-containing protein [Acidobacteria bacterium]|nr:PHP domain-containing protein [Acidobacteriota bacterium]